jgi:hypothetical protein
MMMDAVVGLLQHDGRARLDVVGPGRWHEVVQQRGPSGESLDPEELLGVQAAVRSSMLGVSLGRDVAPGDVEHRPRDLRSVDFRV